MSYWLRDYLRALEEWKTSRGQSLSKQVMASDRSLQHVISISLVAIAHGFFMHMAFSCTWLEVETDFSAENLTDAPADGFLGF